MRLFLARHGITDWTEAGRLQGHTDIPLNERGRDSARTLADELQSVRQEIGLIISSDLKRAAETAQIIAGALSKPILMDQRLREAYFGSLDGITDEDIKNIHGPIMDKTLVEWDFRSFGGEHKSALLERSLAAIKEHRPKLAPETCLLVVSHARTLRTLSRHFNQEVDFTRPASWGRIDLI